MFLYGLRARGQLVRKFKGKTMSAKQVVSLTLAEAESLGIVKCKHCGYPKNNHSNDRKKLCVINATCPGYKPRFTVGTEIKKEIHVCVCGKKDCDYFA